MSLSARVKISGAALTPFNRRKDNSSFRDWACSAFNSALQKSGLEHRDIDALYVASESDFCTMQLNPASVIASDIGIDGVSTTRVEGGGASGQLVIHAATRAIQSGYVKHAAVIGVDPSASSLSSDTIKKLYRRLHCSPLSDGAAATILSRSDSIPASRKNAATIIGVGFVDEFEMTSSGKINRRALRDVEQLKSDTNQASN